MLSISYPQQVEGLPLWPGIVVILALVAFNVVTNRLAPEGHHLLWALGGSFGLLAIGILDGNSWTDMGLGWAHLIPGLLWGVASVGVVTVGYLVAASFRRGRDAMHDQRVAELSGPRLMFQALVQVPFAVVLFEEIAFRAVLFSMLARRFGVVCPPLFSSGAGASCPRSARTSRVRPWAPSSAKAVAATSWPSDCRWSPPRSPV